MSLLCVKRGSTGRSTTISRTSLHELQCRISSRDGVRMRHWKDILLACSASLTSPWAVHTCWHQEAKTALCEYGGAMRTRSSGMRMRHWKDILVGCGASLTSPWAIHTCWHQEAVTTLCECGGQVETTRAPSYSHEVAVHVCI